MLSGSYAAVCNLLDQNFSDVLTTRCKILNDTILDDEGMTGKIICKAGKSYLRNSRTVGQPGANIYACEAAQKYGWRHPWENTSQLLKPVVSKKRVCKGDQIVVQVPHFNFICINGSPHRSVPAMLFEATLEDTVLSMGHNCKDGFSSEKCHECARRPMCNNEGRIDTTPFSVGDVVTIKTSIQTKYDYQITAQHLPFVHYDDSQITIVDFSFQASTDRAKYCKGDTIMVSGDLTCCGSTGSAVGLVLRDEEGGTLASGIASLNNALEFSGTLNIPNTPYAGNATLIAELSNPNDTQNVCRKEISVEIRPFSLSLSTDRYYYKPNSQMQVWGEVTCCGRPGDQGKVEIYDVYNNLVASKDVVVKNDSTIQATLQLPVSVAVGEAKVKLSFSNPSAGANECVEETTVYLTSGDRLYYVAAQMTYENEPVVVDTGCSSDVTVDVKILDSGGNVIESASFACNSPYTFSPLGAGTYTVVATISGAPLTCEAGYCTQQSKFVVVPRPTTSANVPEASMLSVALVLVVIIVIVTRHHYNRAKS
jgi:hypothetical protein